MKHLGHIRKRKHKNPEDVDFKKVCKIINKELTFLRKISTINLKKLHTPFTT